MAQTFPNVWNDFVMPHWGMASVNETLDATGWAVWNMPEIGMTSPSDVPDVTDAWSPFSMPGFGIAIDTIITCFRPAVSFYALFLWQPVEIRLTGSPRVVVGKFHSKV